MRQHQSARSLLERSKPQKLQDSCIGPIRCVISRGNKTAIKSASIRPIKPDPNNLPFFQSKALQRPQSLSNDQLTSFPAKDVPATASNKGQIPLGVGNPSEHLRTDDLLAHMLKFLADFCLDVIRKKDCCAVRKALTRLNE